MSSVSHLLQEPLAAGKGQSPEFRLFTGDDTTVFGHPAEAETIALTTTPLTGALFIESNPIPVKHALAVMGAMPETVRLPLCEASRETAAPSSAPRLVSVSRIFEVCIGSTHMSSITRPSNRPSNRLSNRTKRGQPEDGLSSACGTLWHDALEAWLGGKPMPPCAPCGQAARRKGLRTPLRRPGHVA